MSEAMFNSGSKSYNGYFETFLEEYLIQRIHNINKLSLGVAMKTVCQISQFCGHKHRSMNSHGHLKLVQPFLLQLTGFKQELKANLSLLVGEEEPVAPLAKTTRQKGNVLKYK